MGLSSVVQWWEEWQLHILVLSSLGIQCYLAFFAGSRKSHIRPLYRFIIWLAYLGGHAVAIYALATLFNRQKKLQYKDRSHDLEVIWAPVLLIHLGGQINISAYNIEDNELWRRHILTAASQVTVAVYVFCKSWSHSSDKRLLDAAILLFILGVSKCFHKPMALKWASFNSLVSSFPPVPKTETTLREVELEEYVQAARHFVLCHEDPTQLDKDEQLTHLELLSETDKLFVDSAYAYKDHLTKLKSFWLLDKEANFKALKRHTKLIGIAKFFQCKGLFDQYVSSKPCYSCKGITNLVRDHVRDGWANYISDVESYWNFTDMRGQWTLKCNGCEETLRGSIEKPFDESILLWHVATDFCFHRKVTTSPNISSRCRDISNYMIHLLFANPEMLMPGTRRSLFTSAYNELEDILQGKDLSLLDEKELTKLIMDKVESKEGIIRESWVLAQELMQLGDEKMWEVIKGVWIEMLCFSAGRCRGYLHIKSLGSGGEYLTFVSLLMSHAGLETFVARHQRVELQLPKEARLHIVRIRAMKEEIIEAVKKRKERVDTAKERIEESARKEAAVASPEVEVVII
ncbi:hypothetical protein EJB05_09815, partial [Eragrostis curvula]